MRVVSLSLVMHDRIETSEGTNLMGSIQNA